MASTFCCSSSSFVSAAVATSGRTVTDSRATSSRTASSPWASSVSHSMDTSALAGLRLSCDRRRRCRVLQRSSTRRAPFVVSAEAEEGGGGLREPKAPESPVSPVAPATPVRKRSKVPVKPAKSQRVLLKFLWLEKNIGISLDQVVPGHGIIPLSPYFFWPRKDAWEELKAKLDSKKWISRKRTIVLLNQATDIINLWQQNATNSF